MKKQWKVCKNPECKKKFYREERHSHYQWNRIRFHSRKCQVTYRDKKRRGTPAYRHKGAMNFQALHDCCNRYTNIARKKMREEMTVYSSENMTQEELRELVPSMRG
jgi:hypothetical protein